jgi:hypothetical protein
MNWDGLQQLSLSVAVIVWVTLPFVRIPVSIVALCLLWMWTGMRVG